MLIGLLILSKKISKTAILFIFLLYILVIIILPHIGTTILFDNFFHLKTTQKHEVFTLQPIEDNIYVIIEEDENEQKLLVHVKVNDKIEKIDGDKCSVSYTTNKEPFLEKHYEVVYSEIANKTLKKLYQKYHYVDVKLSTIQKIGCAEDKVKIQEVQRREQD